MPLCLRALIPSTASPRRVQDRVVIMRRLWTRQLEGLARHRHTLKADVPYEIMGIFVRVYMQDSCHCLLAVVRFLVAVVVRNEGLRGRCREAAAPHPCKPSSNYFDFEPHQLQPQYATQSSISSSKDD